MTNETLTSFLKLDYTGEYELKDSRLPLPIFIGVTYPRERNKTADLVLLQAKYKHTKGVVYTVGAQVPEDEFKPEVVKKLIGELVNVIILKVYGIKKDGGTI